MQSQSAAGSLLPEQFEGAFSVTSRETIKPKVRETITNANGSAFHGPSGESLKSKVKKSLDTSVETPVDRHSRSIPMSIGNKSVAFKEPAKAGISKPDHDRKSKSSSGSSQKRVKKGIFVSYSPDAGFLERNFVVDLVRQLKENNLAEDIWFDKDEKITDSPIWFSLRMEAVEKCRAAIVVLSDSYFACPVSMYESATLIDRCHSNPNSVGVFYVMLSQLESRIPSEYTIICRKTVDLTTPANERKSLPEKSSVVIGEMMEELETYAQIRAPPAAPPPAANGTSGNLTKKYPDKKICQWSVEDIQEWMFKLGIKEFYRQSLAEHMVDGFLLMSMTDQDMVHELGIESRIVRKKMMQQILNTLDREYKQPHNWHLRARAQRARPASVYLVYDPADVRLAQSLKQDLSRRGLHVLCHQKLGESKEEFLQANGPNMAAAYHVIVVMTDSMADSPFIYHEVLFSDWLGKRIIVAMFRSVWGELRPSLKAVIGECPAIDFETELYTESLTVLEHHVKPTRSIPGVILEQAFLNRMAEGLRPLSELVSSVSSVTGQQHSVLSTSLGTAGSLVSSPPLIFFSYHWDMQATVDDLSCLLQTHGFSCWTDVNPSAPRNNTTLPGRRPGHSAASGISVASAPPVTAAGDGMIGQPETLRSHIQRSMKAAKVVVSCITPQYIQSDNCIKDLALAQTLRKPVVPVMLRQCPWPPDAASTAVKKMLLRWAPPVEMYNEKLYKQNGAVLVERLARCVEAGRAATRPR